MYHCVPSTISGLSQMFGSSLSDTIAATAIGNNTLAGNAARNCASGWTRCAAHGRSPIQTATGTQIALAIAISTATRVSVSAPSPNALAISPAPRPYTYLPIHHSAVGGEQHEAEPQRVAGATEP